MKLTTTLLFAIILVFSACKKDKLEGESAKLVGEWQWISTEHIHYLWPNDTTYLTPASVGKNYSIDFREKGKIVFKNDDKTFRKRIVMAKYHAANTTLGYDSFNIFLNNKHDLVFNGLVSGDTMILYHNPVTDYHSEEDESDISYFIKN